MRCPHYPERGGAGDFLSTGALSDVRCRPMPPSPTLDVAFVRRQFPALTSNTVFFDNAGGSQILGRVVDRIADYLLTTNVQHGAIYAVSQAASARVAEAQVRTAAFLNAASPDEIVMGPTSTAGPPSRITKPCSPHGCSSTCGCIRGCGYSAPRAETPPFASRP
jgi:hypothetical protein